MDYVAWARLGCLACEIVESAVCMLSVEHKGTPYNCSPKTRQNLLK